ncbi:MAG: hypothetical protein FWB74_04880 [Defluviitaleaceae bacterium]|nr:hypothetical protein [Defluviitaleaceae bacterium]
MHELTLDIACYEIERFEKYAEVMELEHLSLGELIKYAVFEMMEEDEQAWREHEEYEQRLAKEENKGV